MRGETVVVETRSPSGKDNMGNTVYRYSTEAVENVLVSPGSPKDVQESNRPEGAVIAYTLHFPKTYKDDLTHLCIFVRNKKCRVIGSPDRYQEQNTPGKWNMQVLVEAVDG